MALQDAKLAKKETEIKPKPLLCASDLPLLPLSQAHRIKLNQPLHIVNAFLIHLTSLLEGHGNNP